MISASICAGVMSPRLPTSRKPSKAIPLGDVGLGCKPSSYIFTNKACFSASDLAFAAFTIALLIASLAFLSACACWALFKGRLVPVGVLRPLFLAFFLTKRFTLDLRPVTASIARPPATKGICVAKDAPPVPAIAPKFNIPATSRAGL